MTASAAMLMTGIVVAISCGAFALWVSNESRGRDRRSWHRPLVALLGAAAAVCLIVAAWMAVSE